MVVHSQVALAIISVSFLAARTGSNLFTHGPQSLCRYHCLYSVDGYNLSIYPSLPIHYTLVSIKRALLSDLESLPLHLRRAVEPLEPNVPSRKCSFGCIVNSRSLKSRKRWILSLPRLRDSAMSIRIEGHQLSTWRCAYVDHAMSNRLSLGTIVGEYV